MEATTPELGPVRFWSPKSSSLRSCKKLTKSTAESGTPNFFIQQIIGSDRGENYNFSNGQEINHKASVKK